MDKKDFKVVNEVLETDGCRVMGLGLAKIEGYSVVVNVSLDYLERAVKVLKVLHKGEKDANVDIAITRDHPLIIGEYNKETGTIAGIVLAPRITGD